MHSNEKDRIKEPGAAAPKAAPKTTKQNTIIVVNFILVIKRRLSVKIKWMTVAL